MAATPQVHFSMVPRDAWVGEERRREGRGSDERIPRCPSTGVNIPLKEKRGRVSRSTEDFPMLTVVCRKRELAENAN